MRVDLDPRLGGLLVSGVVPHMGLPVGVLWFDIQIPSILIPCSIALEPKGISSSPISSISGLRTAAAAVAAAAAALNLFNRSEL